MTIQNLRIGHGFDVHKFSSKYLEAKPLILASVTLPDELSLLAHSDGDVVIHALCDSILGALGLGDIGDLFPDTDESIAGIESTKILEHVLDLVSEKSGQLVNVDITIVAEQPKISPHRIKMRQALSALLNLPQESINVKATTTEKLGYIGRREGIACHCVLLLALSE